MQMERDIRFLRGLASRTSGDIAGSLERIIRLLDLIQTTADSPSEQAERAERAASELRLLIGLDDDDHNEVSLIAERVNAARKDLVVLSNAIGY
ncbi:hypothetical protein HZC53_01835 [Candidatus Uhrbacteria bacterium]|nr:hypothetical protein [Candidatus Uhrbacteria bacterium]